MRGPICPRRRYAQTREIAEPIPNWMIASVPEAALAMNAATDEVTASNMAVNTAVIPNGYALDTPRPRSTCISRTRPTPWI